jgi:beta-galactosidase
MTRRVTRRGFLQGTAAVAAGVSLVPQALAGEQVRADAAWPENGTLVPDEGWRLWVDDKAEWRMDALFLPEDVTRGAEGVVLGGGKPLPVNAPTGGWGVLGAVAGIPVTLPGTVEQHFWGKYGAGADGKPRPYTPEEYRYAADDAVPMNGAYFGVSWWWRTLEIPASMRGKRIFLHVRGAHLRAEVYLNERLVGYSIMEELPFECDLTAAARPGGVNTLAIRITNPFGRFDWVDGSNEQWGAVKLYRSHGFGGLDRGMTMSAHGEPVRIADLWVLNQADSRKISVFCKLRTTDGHLNGGGSVKLDVIDPRTGAVLASNLKPGDHNAFAFTDTNEGTFNDEVRYESARLWKVEDPQIYHLRATLIGEMGSGRTIAFGFRSFAPEGLGTNALFRLNGRRVKIYTAISWGFWGINGMWPTPELAVKEVTQAKKLGLNCLNFHRNLAKEDVLRAHDRLGVMRYMEPGAGKLAIGKLPASAATDAANTTTERPVSAADRFAQRYMFVKCVEMVKAFRSHPSVIEYCLQNEIGADLKNPDTIAVLEAMRAEDPSRCIVLNDGFVAPPHNAAQAWFAPWDAKLHRSDEEEWGGWWNQHQGAGNQWYDEFYQGPGAFTYKSPVKAALSEFGEMEGCATPDNHSLMLHQLAAPKAGGIGAQPANRSYDLEDHREILAAYDRFLDRWGFRGAFPATERLWLDLGKKCYDTWQNYMENARISDELDFCAISGWETTAIENHSGIVDNLRNFKSDPGPISGALLPVRPVAKQRAMCTAVGEAATFDLFLLNDTDRAVGGTVSLSAVSPSGRLVAMGEFPAPAWVRDQFSYLVKEAVVTPRLDEVGMWRFRCACSAVPGATQTKEIWVTGVVPVLRDRALMVGVSGITPRLRGELVALGSRVGAAVVDYSAGGKFDLIVSSGITAKVSATQSAGDTTGLEAQPVARAQAVVQVGVLAEGIVEAVRAGTPLLAIPQADALSDGVAKQLAAAGAFTYAGNVGDLRAPWMGNWYFVRKHALYEGLPVDQAMGIHYQVKGKESNGLLVDGPDVAIVAAYSRDHGRRIGAGTFTTKLGKGKVVYQRVPELHPVLQAQFLANAAKWLVG